MTEHFLLKPKRVFVASALFALCSIIVYIMIGLINFPDEIHIFEGSENNITASFPFKAVVNQESVTASNASDERIFGNIDKTGESVVVDSQEELDMTLALFGFPVRNVTLDILPDIEVVPCGVTVGVQINADGVMVLGTGGVDAEDGTTVNPSSGILLSGDLIIESNGIEIENQAHFMEIVKKSDGKSMDIVVKREGENVNVSVTPIKSILDNQYRIGAWVRDGTKGIGTVTYYNPITHTFGALGHGILDVDTNKLITVKKGEITQSSIVKVKKGKKGSPGELVGKTEDSIVLGNIKTNTTLGLYGNMKNVPYGISDKTMKIGLQNEVHEGPATIRSNVNGTETKEYDVFIEAVNRYSSDHSKGLIVRITDQSLLAQTSGIVQGMSGSPIIQDGKLIGAVTHVFVQNPAKGYGIFIENMIKQEKKM